MDRLRASDSNLNPSAIPEIEPYELDDIPLYHIPAPGSTILTVTFRVGRADEPVIHGGMTHLAEHLFLTAISDSLDHSNGATGPYHVSFIVRGTPHDASKFLRDLCKTIENPRYGRIHQEANVLRTEEAGRGGGGLSIRMVALRTGYQGLGTLTLPEFFMRAPDDAVRRAWIAEHFVAGNAAIAIAGELPDDLFVLLEPGPRKPAPPFAVTPGFDAPTVVLSSGPGVGVSFLVERNVATLAALHTFERHLRKALRVDRGLGYEVGSDYLPIGPDRAFANFWATCLPASVRDVERVLLERLDDLCARGPTEEELAQQYDDFLRNMADPVSIPGRLQAHVHDVLLGAEPASPTELASQRRDLQSDRVAGALKKVRESMLLLVPPPGTRPQRPLKPYPGPSLAPTGHGQSFAFVKSKRVAPWKEDHGIKLTIGDAGIAVERANGPRFVGVGWSECVGVVKERGVRNVLGRDGTLLSVHESDWKDGPYAINLVDRRAPSGLIVPEAR